MKFRMGPYYIPLHVCSILVATIGIAVGLWFILVGLPGSDNLEVGYTFIISASIFLFGIIQLMRTVSFPWISFSHSGVTKKWLFNVNAYISWEECEEIGIILAKISGGKNHGAFNWVYFSKIPLTDEQLHSRKKPNLPPTDLIMVEYYPKVLNEVLKYIPKERIRNLHLIEQ